MATLRDLFAVEAQACHEGIAALLRADDAMVTPTALLPLVRGLRGTAGLAEEQRAYRIACALEGATRALLDGDLTWSTDVRERVERTLGDLEVILSAAEPGPALDQRVEDTVARWKALGVRPWAPATETRGGASEGTALEDEAFLSFAAAEIDGIVTVLGESVDALAGDPLDREPLKSILRRQRVLLGAARLNDLPVVAETLRAVEDVSRIIARMNVAIKDEWLEVFRCARAVLETSAEPLARGDDPPHTPALSRLRTYRQELLERYGTSEEDPVDVLAATEGAPAEPDPPVTAPEMDIQGLVYSGQAALRRALELRARLERAVEHDADALALVDEVFDLIRLGLE